MMAEELMHYTLRTMWDDESGALFDRDTSGDPAEPLPQTVKPFVLNSEAAVILHRLAQATNDAMFARRAAEIIDALAPAALRQGAIAAHYQLARRAVLR
jgi:hypothetical protein